MYLTQEFIHISRQHCTTHTHTHNPDPAYRCVLKVIETVIGEDEPSPLPRLHPPTYRKREREGERKRVRVREGGGRDRGGERGRQSHRVWRRENTQEFELEIKICKEKTEKNKAEQ